MFDPVSQAAAAGAVTLAQAYTAKLNLDQIAEARRREESCMSDLQRQRLHEEQSVRAHASRFGANPWSNSLMLGNLLVGLLIVILIATASPDRGTDTQLVGGTVSEGRSDAAGFVAEASQPQFLQKAADQAPIIAQPVETGFVLVPVEDARASAMIVILPGATAMDAIEGLGTQIAPESKAPPATERVITDDFILAEERGTKTADGVRLVRSEAAGSTQISHLTSVVAAPYQAKAFSKA